MKIDKSDFKTQIGSQFLISRLGVSGAQGILNPSFRSVAASSQRTKGSGVLTCVLGADKPGC